MILYRYISLDRLFSSLRQIKDEWRFASRFNSPINFEDKWEGLGNGLVNQLDVIEIEKSYSDRVELDGGVNTNKKHLREYLNKKSDIKENLDSKLFEAIKYSNEHLMSCWFKGEKNSPDLESFAMWNLYAKHNGILIGYEKNEIDLVLKKLDFTVSENNVKYVDFLNSEFKSKLHCKLESLFLKDEAYKHEREYRYLINKKSKVKFKDIELPLPKYLIANPSFSEKTISELNKVIKTYGNLTLKKSKLSTKFSRNEIFEYLK